MTKFTLKNPSIRGVLLISVFCAVCFYGYTFIKSNSVSPQDARKVVEVVQPQIKNMQQTIRLIGTVKSKHATTLMAQAQGTLRVVVPAGTRVKEGALVAKIESIDTEKTLELSEAAERIAQIQFERLRVLLKAGHTSPQSVEQKKSLLIDAQKALASAKNEFKKGQFLAPFEGIVGAYKCRDGSQVNVGDQVVPFYDPLALVVDFDIPANVLKYIKDGQPVLIEGKKHALTHVQQMIDAETHMSPASVDDVSTDYMIGAQVHVDLPVLQKEKALVIPFECVFLRDGKPFVYVVQENQTVPKAVELGLREKEQVEILSGLGPEEAVVVRGQSRLYPWMEVKIHEPDSSKAGQK